MAILKIFFISHTTAALIDSTQLLKDGISLRVIREMQEFVKAKHQLIIIEAS